MEKNGWLTHIEWVVMFLTILGAFYSIDSKFDSMNHRIDSHLLLWHEEAKDFHGRLCAIEERNKK